MKPIELMLASPMKKGVITNWGEWAAEEKFDGHRITVHVNRIGTAGNGLEVSAFARQRADGRMIQRELPDHLVADIDALTEHVEEIVLDGELMGGADDAVGTDATRKDLAHLRRFVVFDVLHTTAGDATKFTYQQRRMILEKLFRNRRGGFGSVSLAGSHSITSESDLVDFVEAVWANGGEGAILKHRHSTYYPGKRSGQRGCPICWIKIKRVSHATLTVVGFERSRGTVRFPGHPFAIVKLRDDDGNETTCKTKNDAELKRLTVAWNQPHRPPRALPLDEKEAATHPWVGTRQLVIEFPKRTRDGGYQGPVIWDRWEDE